MEGETRLRRGSFVYGGGDSSTKGEARLGTILDAIGNVQNGPNTVCAEYMYMNIYTYVHIDIYSYVCIYVCMYVCMLNCIYVCMYLYVYYFTFHST